MTVEPYEPFLLQITRNPLGLTELPVYVDARPHSWMMDPTAPFNLISRSEAKEAGLKVSDEFATVRTLTGRPIQMHMTVIPRFTIGGRITFRNMTAFVFEDADYAFPRSRYQVEGVLGYAALSALGSLTITSDATVEVRPFKPPLASEKEDPPMPGASFFLDGDQMILALGSPGQERMFQVDASGQQTYLTSRYYDEHAENFNGQKDAVVLGSRRAEQAAAAGVRCGDHPPHRRPSRCRGALHSGANPAHRPGRAGRRIRRAGDGLSRSVEELYVRLPDHAVHSANGVRASQR
jgi:hypothetical protein